MRRGLHQDSALFGIENVENAYFFPRHGVDIDKISVALIVANKFVSGGFLAVHGDHRKSGSVYAKVGIQLFLRFADGNLCVQLSPGAVIFQKRHRVEAHYFPFRFADLNLYHIGIIHGAVLFVSEIEGRLRAALVHPYGGHVFIAERGQIIFRDHLGAFQIKILSGAIFVEIEAYQFAAFFGDLRKQLSAAFVVQEEVIRLYILRGRFARVIGMIYRIVLKIAEAQLFRAGGSDLFLLGLFAAFLSFRRP